MENNANKKRKRANLEVDSSKIILHKITKDPEVQFFFTNLFFDFLLLAQMVEKNGEYFSVEDEETEGYEDVDHLKAEIMFLRFILNDKDHRIKGVNYEAANIYYTNGRPKYIYDLGSCVNFFSWTFDLRAHQVKNFFNEYGINSVRIFFSLMVNFKNHILNFQPEELKCKFPFTVGYDKFRQEVLYRLEYMLKLASEYINKHAKE